MSQPDSRAVGAGKIHYKPGGLKQQIWAQNMGKAPESFVCPMKCRIME